MSGYSQSDVDAADAFKAAAVTRPRRIGLFGGAFDPVHDAHLALARAAMDQLTLDEVIWIPTGQPWYKNSPMVGTGHRLAMVDLAIGDEPRFVLDPRETERAGPTYTIDTVIELQSEFAARAAVLAGDADVEIGGNSSLGGHVGADATSPSPTEAEWFLIVGQDQLAKFHTWQGWQALVSRVTLAVAGRAGDEPLIGKELEAAPIRLVKIDLPPMNVSSTEIRNCLAQGRGLAGLVPPAVASYIARHALYTAA
ncbi:nicotinate-nucleotide adenylyltransferase [soil metagenome]